MGSRIRTAQAFLSIDGAVLFFYGIVSLLFAPGSPSEPYLSFGRVLYGVLPTALGLGSVGCAAWLGFARPQVSARSDPA